MRTNVRQPTVAVERFRTRNLPLLTRPPLPVGPQGLGTRGRIRTANLPVLNGTPLPVGLRGLACSRGESNPPLPRLSTWCLYQLGYRSASLAAP
jgi:hypothetical protein